MNFYKRFIGDITAKTGGLSMAQMGAYDRLLDHYYSTALPIAVDEVYRICRAMSKHEKADVDSVLSKFWELGPSGFTQSKADEVIAKAMPLIEAARANGKLGGRPKKPKTHAEPSGLSVKEEKAEENENMGGVKNDFAPSEKDQAKTAIANSNDNKNNDLLESEKPTGFEKKTQQEPSGKAIQSQNQNTSSLRSEVNAQKRVVRPEDVEEQTWLDWVELRKDNKAKVSKTALAEARKEAGKAGMSLQRFLEVWVLRGTRGLMADWIKPHERGRAAGTRNILELDHREGIAEDGSLI